MTIEEKCQSIRRLVRQQKKAYSESGYVRGGDCLIEAESLFNQIKDELEPLLEEVKEVGELLNMKLEV